MDQTHGMDNSEVGHALFSASRGSATSINFLLGLHLMLVYQLVSDMSFLEIVSSFEIYLYSKNPKTKKNKKPQNGTKAVI